MDYEFSSETRSDHLHVQVSGVRTREAVSALTADLFNAANRAQQSKILVDVRDFKGRLGAFDSLFVVRDEFTKYRGGGISKAAIVDREIQEKRRWFFETVAQNRGFNLKMFSEVREAQEWLCE
jgi:hypothetical protein